MILSGRLSRSRRSMRDVLPLWEAVKSGFSLHQGRFGRPRFYVYIAKFRFPEPIRTPQKKHSDGSSSWSSETISKYHFHFCDRARAIQFSGRSISSGFR
ncbi:hypothetical protein VTG60DRAFT_3492 [Thermothelomyces hinnuleus]